MNNILDVIQRGKSHNNFALFIKLLIEENDVEFLKRYLINVKEYSDYVFIFMVIDICLLILEQEKVTLRLIITNVLYLIDKGNYKEALNLIDKIPTS